MRVNELMYILINTYQLNKTLNFLIKVSPYTRTMGTKENCFKRLTFQEDLLEESRGLKTK